MPNNEGGSNDRRDGRHGRDCWRCQSDLGFQQTSGSGSSTRTIRFTQGEGVLGVQGGADGGPWGSAQIIRPTSRADYLSAPHGRWLTITNSGATNIYIWPT